MARTHSWQRAALIGISMCALWPAASQAQAETIDQAQQAAPEASRIPAGAEIEKAIQAAYREAKPIKEGKNADYIPYLAKVPSGLFAIAVVTVDGHPYSVGDDSHAFPIESVVKPFTLARL